MTESTPVALAVEWLGGNSSDVTAVAQRLDDLRDVALSPEDSTPARRTRWHIAGALQVRLVSSSETQRFAVLVRPGDWWRLRHTALMRTPRQAVVHVTLTPAGVTTSRAHLLGHARGRERIQLIAKPILSVLLLLLGAPLLLAGRVGVGLAFLLWLVSGVTNWAVYLATFVSHDRNLGGNRLLRSGVLVGKPVASVTLGCALAAYILFEPLQGIAGLAQIAISLAATVNIATYAALRDRIAHTALRDLQDRRAA